MSQPEQRRILATSIPGPKSQKLQVQRVAELSSGLGVTMPVFIERAGGGILVDVDGNHIIDFASGIAVTSVGASDPAVVRRIAEQAERFTHTCFLVTEYEGFVDVAAALNRLTPGDHPKRTALFTTGAEAVENAIKIARTATRRPARDRARACLPRTHPAHDDHDGEERALQAGLSVHSLRRSTGFPRRTPTDGRAAPRSAPRRRWRPCATR